MSVAVLALSVGYSAYVEDGARKVQVLQIQQVLRDRYLDYKPTLDKLQVEHYPGDKSSYTVQERYQLGRYWSEIQFNEFLVIKKFGRGVLEHEWKPVYGVWASNALEEFEVLREEFCHFIRNEKGFMGTYAKEFELAIRDAYESRNSNQVINCDALLRNRKDNTSSD